LAIAHAHRIAKKDIIIFPKTVIGKEEGMGKVEKRRIRVSETPCMMRSRQVIYPGTWVLLGQPSLGIKGARQGLHFRLRAPRCRIRREGVIDDLMKLAVFTKR